VEPHHPNRAAFRTSGELSGPWEGLCARKVAVRFLAQILTVVVEMLRERAREGRTSIALLCPELSDERLPILCAEDRIFVLAQIRATEPEACLRHDTAFVEANLGGYVFCDRSTRSCFPCVQPASCCPLLGLLHAYSKAEAGVIAGLAAQRGAFMRTALHDVVTVIMHTSGRDDIQLPVPAAAVRMAERVAAERTREGVETALAAVRAWRASVDAVYGICTAEGAAPIRLEVHSFGVEGVDVACSDESVPHAFLHSPDNTVYLLLTSSPSSPTVRLEGRGFHGLRFVPTSAALLLADGSVADLGAWT